MILDSWNEAEVASVQLGATDLVASAHSEIQSIVAAMPQVRRAPDVICYLVDRTQHVLLNVASLADRLDMQRGLGRRQYAGSLCVKDWPYIPVRL